MAGGGWVINLQLVVVNGAAILLVTKYLHEPGKKTRKCVFFA